MKVVQVMLGIVVLGSIVLRFIIFGLTFYELIEHLGLLLISASIGMACGERQFGFSYQIIYEPIIQNILFNAICAALLCGLFVMMVYSDLNDTTT
mgnify:CR=1 FL=1